MASDRTFDVSRLCFLDSRGTVMKDETVTGCANIAVIACFIIQSMSRTRPTAEAVHLPELASHHRHHHGGAAEPEPSRTALGLRSSSSLPSIEQQSGGYRTRGLGVRTRSAQGLAGGVYTSEQPQQQQQQRQQRESAMELSRRVREPLLPHRARMAEPQLPPADFQDAAIAGAKEVARALALRTNPDDADAAEAAAEAAAARAAAITAAAVAAHPTYSTIGRSSFALMSSSSERMQTTSLPSIHAGQLPTRQSVDVQAHLRLSSTPALPPPRQQQRQQQQEEEEEEGSSDVALRTAMGRYPDLSPRAALARAQAVHTLGQLPSAHGSWQDKVDERVAMRIMPMPAAAPVPTRGAGPRSKSHADTSRDVPRAREAMCGQQEKSEPSSTTTIKPPVVVPRLPHVAVARQAQLKTAFARFDSDGSGSLSVSELAKILSLQTSPTKAPLSPGSALRKAAEVVRKYDVDGSGTLDVVEFIAWSTRAVHSQSASPPHQASVPASVAHASRLPLRRSSAGEVAEEEEVLPVMGKRDLESTAIGRGATIAGAAQVVEEEESLKAQGAIEMARGQLLSERLPSLDRFVAETPEEEAILIKPDRDSSSVEVGAACDEEVRAPHVEEAKMNALAAAHDDEGVMRSDSFDAAEAQPPEAFAGAEDGAVSAREADASSALDAGVPQDRAKEMSEAAKAAAGELQFHEVPMKPSEGAGEGASMDAGLASVGKHHATARFASAHGIGNGSILPPPPHPHPRHPRRHQKPNSSLPSLPHETAQRGVVIPMPIRGSPPSIGWLRAGTFGSGRTDGRRERSPTISAAHRPALHVSYSLTERRLVGGSSFGKLTSPPKRLQRKSVPVLHRALHKARRAGRGTTSTATAAVEAICKSHQSFAMPNADHSGVIGAHAPRQELPTSRSLPALVPSPSLDRLQMPPAPQDETLAFLMSTPAPPLPAAHATAAAAAAAARERETATAAKIPRATSGLATIQPRIPNAKKRPTSPVAPVHDGAYVAQSVAEKKWPTLSPRAAVAKEEALSRLAMLPPGMGFASEITEKEAISMLRGGGLPSDYW